MFHIMFHTQPLKFFFSKDKIVTVRILENLAENHKAVYLRTAKHRKCVKGLIKSIIKQEPQACRDEMAQGERYEEEDIM